MALSDADLRSRHDFVRAFETLRKRSGFREMSDTALRFIAGDTAVPFEELRIARHLRNAIAHDELVNEEALGKYLTVLRAVLDVDGPEEPLEQGHSMTYDDFDAQAYRIHAWRDPRLEQLMLANGYVSIGGDEIGDLANVTDPEEIRHQLAENMPDKTQRAIAIYVGYWKRFLWEAQAGDLVVLPTQDRAIAVGEFAGPYFYVASADPRARHRRAVAWANTGIPRADLQSDLLRVISGKHTLQEFKFSGAATRLQAIAATGFDPGS